MAVEAIWTMAELQNLGAAMKDLEERLQEWEGEYDLKISDVLIPIEKMRTGEAVGLVGLRSKEDTILQFEALEAQIGIQ